MPWRSQVATPEQRRLSAQIAANTRWAREDGHANGLRGQRGLTARFEREILAAADGPLSERELARRVECARKAHFTRLALASSKVRAAKKAAAG
jgi:hypothetical protein